jgi:hypothetical protein
MTYCNSAKACPWNSYLIAGFVVESSKAAVLLSESVAPPAQYTSNSINFGRKREGERNMHDLRVGWGYVRIRRWWVTFLFFFSVRTSWILE